MDARERGRSREPCSSPGSRSGTFEVCDACGRSLIQLLELDALGDVDWRLVRWCPNCGCISEVVCSGAQLEAFEVALERGEEELRRELREWEHANMEQLLRLLCIALENDLITADDFR